MFKCAINGQVDKAQHLLAAGGKHVSLTDKDENGDTPLYLACLYGHEAFVAFLISHDAPINAKNSKGYTPMHAAAYNGSTACVRLLLRNEAVIDARSRLHWTPLHRAVYRGHTGVTELLLQWRADVNAANVHGITPLVLAAHLNDLRASDLLLRYGARTDCRTAEGHTPLDVCRERGHLFLYDFMQTRACIVQLRQEMAALRAQRPAEVAPAGATLAELSTRHDRALTNALSAAREQAARAPRRLLAHGLGWTAVMVPDTDIAPVMLPLPPSTDGPPLSGRAGSLPTGTPAVAQQDPSAGA